MKLYSSNDEYLLSKEIDTICFKDGDKIYDNFKLLKPLPNKIDQGYPCEKYDEGYSHGWDACIDEILGE